MDLLLVSTEDEFAHNITNLPLQYSQSTATMPILCQSEFDPPTIRIINTGRSPIGRASARIGKGHINHRQSIVNPSVTNSYLTWELEYYGDRPKCLHEGRIGQRRVICQFTAIWCKPVPIWFKPVPIQRCSSRITRAPIHCRSIVN